MALRPQRKHVVTNAGSIRSERRVAGVSEVATRLVRVVGSGVIAWLSAVGASGQTATVNFETAPVHPLEMTPDGTRLLATNTADGRLEVFTLGGTLPLYAGSIPVGLDPVSVRVRSNTEAWVVNQISDTVSVVNLTTMNVVQTLHPGNEPCDLVFFGAGASQRAYVSVSRENVLRVYDPNNLAASPTSVGLAGNCPKAMAADATRVFVAFFEAGNRSSVAPRAVVDDPTGPWLGQNPAPNVGSGGAGGSFNPALNPALPPGPATSIIINREGNPGNFKDDANVIWDSKIPWALQEHGVAIYTVGTGVVTYASNIANVNMSLGVQPSTGKVTVVGHHLTNYVRFEPKHRSVFGRSYFSFFDPANPPGPTGGPGAGTADLNSHLYANGVSLPYTSSPTPAQVALSVSDPRAVVWTGSTDAYVASMGTNLVAHVSNTGVRKATINVGKGPAGLALDAARGRLYVFNRFAGTISSINTGADAVVGSVSFFDPTPAALKPGRDLFYNAQANSKLGIVSCASCHVDTRSDMQSWDAGDPSGSMKVFDQTCDAGMPFGGVCGDWHPMKGPFMTQNLADTVGVGPLHWRGDREDILAFSGGFPGFLGSAAPSAAQMQTLETFLTSLRREPNPYRTVTDGLPPSVPGFAGNPASGQALFYGPAINGAIAKCTDCHSLATGGGATVISANILGQSQSLKTPPLRNLYVKTGFDQTSGASRRGFGFGHDGAVDTIANLMKNHFAPSATPQQRADLEAFLMCFPSGTHPAVGMQVTCTSVNKNDASVIGQLATFASLADSGAVGLIAKGVVGGVPRGYQYVAGAGTMQSDRVGLLATIDALRVGVVGGAEVTFTVVAAGTERRLGIDRDADGYLDRDEIDNGSNPADPLSVPPSGCRPTIAVSPAPADVCPGGQASFGVTPGGGNGVYAYQWRRGGVNLADQPGHVMGAATALLTIQGAGAADVGVYDCLVTDGCGSTPSGTAQLRVCAADVDCSGGVDLGDFFAFFNCFDQSLSCADVNGDAQVDLADFFEFLNDFDAGC